jgi:hypothetical protein
VITNLKPIAHISRLLWQDRPVLKHRFDHALWSAAEAHDNIHDVLPVSDGVGLDCHRLHDEFELVCEGSPSADKVANEALRPAFSELAKLGFKGQFGDRSVVVRQLGVRGQMDAFGLIDNRMPCIVELKTVRFIPQVVRAADSAQLTMYGMGRFGEKAVTARRVGLMVVYVQAIRPFRTGVRVVSDPRPLVPLVKELNA